jgi:DNA-binding NarL/FixJ family response regulator
MKSNIRVLLVDDHDITRYGLRRMLESEGDIEVVGDCANAEEAISKVEVLFPDIVLMDIKMPGIDGIEATQKLKAKQPACTIIVLTLYEDYVAEAIKAGATGYLLKDCRREELIQAIRAVQQGKAPLSPLNREFFTKLATLFKDTDLASLSERELDILRLIANGATTREIGIKVFLSEASVKRDVRHILDKLGVHNRSEAVAEAYRRKIVCRE